MIKHKGADQSHLNTSHLDSSIDSYRDNPTRLTQLELAREHCLLSAISDACLLGVATAGNVATFLGIMAEVQRIQILVLEPKT